MKITRQHIASIGCLNWHQFKLLGVSWPPHSGWPSKVVGREISESKWNFVRMLKGLKKERDDLLRCAGILPGKLAQMSNEEAWKLEPNAFKKTDQLDLIQ